jgi:hypothetical protein
VAFREDENAHKALLAIADTTRRTRESAPVEFNLTTSALISPEIVSMASRLVTMRPAV